MDSDVVSLAPAGGEFEGALGVPKDSQGTRLVLSGTTYVYDLCSPKVFSFGTVLTPKAISPVTHSISRPHFPLRPKTEGPGHL